MITLMKFSIVIAIYTFGVNSTRYNLTEKMFMYYQYMQKRFQNYTTFSFTIIGSEEHISRDLTLKYFPADSYYEVDQGAASPDPDYVPDLNIPASYEIIRKKINFGMKTAYHKDHDADVIFWVGSNDFISLNFWRQVMEDYNPQVMKWYGLGTYFRGRNAAYYTLFDGTNMLNREHPDSFFHNGKQPYILGYSYIGAVNGITRTALKRHPQILKFWNHNEGEIESFVFRQNEKVDNSSLLIQAFASTECFTMNVKTPGYDTSVFTTLRAQFTKVCHYGFSEADGFVSPLFWSNFDEECDFFDRECRPSLIVSQGRKVAM